VAIANAYFCADMIPPKPRDVAKPHIMRTSKGLVPLLWLGFFRPMNVSWVDQPTTNANGAASFVKVPCMVCPRSHAVRQYAEFQRAITALPMLGPMVMTISDDLIPETEKLTQNFIYVEDYEVQLASGKTPSQYHDWLRRCLTWVEAVASRKLRGDAVLNDPAGVDVFNSVRVRMPQCEITWEGMEWDAVLGGYRNRASVRMQKQ